MFKAFFAATNASPLDGEDTSLAARDGQTVAEILCSAQSIMPFTVPEAKIAATYMSTCHYRERDVIIQEGGRTELDYLLLILDGEATFEASLGGGASKPVMVRVLGPGAALGSMSMFDGEPRSLHGIASMPTRCAKLTRVQLKALCREHPQVGVKLMAVICLNFSQTLRELTIKFKTHVRLNNVLNAELQGSDAQRFNNNDTL